jgi:hypothetical protein
MKLSVKKRLALGAAAIATVGAVSTLAAGVTFGLFSANQGSSISTFATGTVAFNSPAVDNNCTVSNMVPGDESANYVGTDTGETDTKFATCEFAVKYNGSAPAYIGLATTLTGTLGGQLLWEITEATTNSEPVQPGLYTTTGVINTNMSTDPLYVATDNGNGGGGDLTYYFWVDYLLPSSVTSQSFTAANLTLTVYAVQKGNNGTGVCTQGVQCSLAGIPNWS